MMIYPPKQEDRNSKVEIRKKKNFKLDSKTIGLGVLLLLIVFAGAFIVINRGPDTSNYQALTLHNGFKFLYNPTHWTLSTSTLGDSLTSIDNKITIAFNQSQISSDESLDQIVADRISTLNKDNLTINEKDESINNHQFKRVIVNAKDDANIINNDSIDDFINLENKVYTNITIVYSKDVQSSQVNEALSVVESLK